MTSTPPTTAPDVAIPGREVVAELRRTCEALAQRAGDLVLQMRREAVDVAATKSSLTDVVTRADLASEKLLTELIEELRPQDGVLGEEGARRVGQSGLTWVLDPIDGTVNYLYGRADYAVSVAVVAGDPADMTAWRPVAGAVHAPVHHRTFSAGLGLGASDGDRELRVPPAPELAQALVGTGFSYDAAVRAWQGRVLADVLPRVRDVRRAGAGALDACAVAAGELDAHVERGLQPWDVAAAELIVTEAGGAVRHDRQDDGSIVTVITSRDLLGPLGDLFAHASRDV
ncbi:inositol monophosphatase family protein [Litorihabitans aurantiacus]|uniref:Inositol-1-monophosphatase n=1 Tax=Litorihabitans aurantiacus TaxID=1930061 RepID=A0AA37XE39_9MICO|nr:inositol monophosphatase family protein [Litorihabitans aurantiacus]GMA31453.1 inositol monophosphatase [Litorihabitans aurantiacus]